MINDEPFVKTSTSYHTWKFGNIPITTPHLNQIIFELKKLSLYLYSNDHYELQNLSIV